MHELLCVWILPDGRLAFYQMTDSLSLAHRDRSLYTVPVHSPPGGVGPPEGRGHAAAAATAAAAAAAGWSVGSPGGVGSPEGRMARPTCWSVGSPGSVGSPEGRGNAQLFPVRAAAPADAAVRRLPFAVVDVG